MKHIDANVINDIIAQASMVDVNREDLLLILSMLDHTSLSNSDSPETMVGLVAEIDQLLERDMPTPATVCVYPALVESVGMEMGESSVGITSVCGGFPSGLTYLEVKILECAMAIENGADEIDIVINTGAMLSSDYEIASAEIEAIVHEINGDAILKVILETGVLKEEGLIMKAAHLALNAGADFIKTSTGKSIQGATPEAVALMCIALSEHEQASGLRKGLKVAGGIDTPQQAIVYLNIVRRILGDDYLIPSLMRFGSSKLLKNIVAEFDKNNW